MNVAVLLSVVSGAVVASALSSAAVQLQPTAVLVTRSRPVQVPVQQHDGFQTAPRSAAVAPARPLYVDLPSRSSTVALRATGTRQAAAPRVDVLSCSRAWSARGECPGTETEVLRGALVDAAGRAVELPLGAHVRVSTAGDGVQVEVRAAPLPADLQVPLGP